jgi:pimeloyl-ACP methyl ester carboxylesterase
MLKIVGHHSGEAAAGLPPLYILHGMFGAGDNWLNIARELGQRRRVSTMDLPGHGESADQLPEGSGSFRYPAMAAAAREAMLATTGREPAVLLGHSMGGKTAMALALADPGLVQALVVVDTAPRSYVGSGFNQEALDMIAALDATKAGSRTELDCEMRAWINESAMRGFLLKSLVPRPEGGFRWRFAAAAILAGAPDIADWPPVPAGTAAPCPALFIKGGESPYIIPERDLPLIKALFPKAELAVIEGARHWVHFDSRAEFVALLDRFLL